ncbi:MAG: efflux RND transporter permease subunit, partial [Acidobacteriota bacterium]|nr:efflux RND transporter permease subunit [Acidobacteriota bacterium]
VNQPRARRAGVTSQDVAISLQTFLSGLEATEFREDDKLIPVTLRSVAAERQDIDKLETLNVYAQLTGESVPLKQVADIEVVWQPSKIKRYDRLKTVTVESALQPGFTATQINAHLKPWLEEQQESWGLGYSWEFGGEAESSGESDASIQVKLPYAFLIIILLLIAQFNSVRRTTIILLTIPLSVIGVVIGLIVAQSYFGFMTLLGIIALAGIVINNGIVLLDRINIEIRDHGREPAEAVVEAAQRRLRPILLTTVTTVGGLLPLWLGGGVMYRPMAIAIIFGLVFATALTLGVVPILYSLLFRVSFKGVIPTADRGV